MFRSSFPIGRFLGVELRLHASVPALLALALIYSDAATGSVVRGFGVCLALVLGIAIREAARALTAAYNGLSLRALLIFPVGGIMAFASPGADLDASTRLVTIVAPFANLLAGFLVLGISYGIDPNVHLLAQPWISPLHVLRSLVWTQFALAALSLAPLAALTTRQIAGPKKTGQAPAQNGGLSVSDVMQTSFTFLSSSDTLRSALERTVSSSQEVFPVVRGDQLVGSVARSTLVRQLQTEGDGYLQGVMTRTLPLAFPAEALGVALRRSAAAGPAELTAVVENGILLGILAESETRQTMQRTAALRLMQSRDADE